MWTAPVTGPVGTVVAGGVGVAAAGFAVYDAYNASIYLQRASLDFFDRDILDWSA
jgi:hypothetical protein